MYAGDALLDFGVTANNTWYAVQAYYAGASSHLNIASIASPTGADTGSQNVGAADFGGGLFLGVSGGGDQFTGYVSEVGIWNGSVAAGMGANQIASLGSAAPTAPAISALPVISGATTVGSTLTTTTGTWTGSPTGYTYQWKRNGTNISGATSNTYLLVTADLTANITATVTATNAGGSTSSTAAAVGPVTSAGYQGPGDLTSGASCFFGLRAYSAAQRGGTTKAIRICKNDFTAQQDIPILTTGGLLDYSAITPAGKPRTASEVVVMNWCNQLDGSGATDLTYGLMTQLPRLVISPPGLATGFAALQCTGSVPTRIQGGGFTFSSQPITVSLITNQTGPTTGFRGGIVCGDGVQPKVGYENGSNTFFLEAGGTPHDFGVANNNTWYATQSYFNGASSHMNIASVASPTGVDTASFDVGSSDFGAGVYFGLTAGSGDAFTGYVTEFGVWPGSVAAGMGANQIASLGSATPTAPVNSALPVITGTTTVGQTLTTTTGTWTGSPTGYTYQWKRSGTNISGATASTYTLVSADATTFVTVLVTATNAAGSANATAATVGPIAAAPSEDPATTAWVNAVVTAGGTVSTTQRSRVDTLITAYKTAGVWALLEHEWLFAAENVQCATVDIVGRASHTIVGTNVFTAYRGFKEGGFGGHIDLGYAPSTSSLHLQNTASFGLYSVTSRTVDSAATSMGTSNIAAFSYSIVMRL